MNRDTVQAFIIGALLATIVTFLVGAKAIQEVQRERLRDACELAGALVINGKAYLCFPRTEAAAPEPETESE